MSICAIHQPNFFPWNGYFDKIRQADIFIFLDQVAYPKSGSGSGSWCNRVKLLNNNEPAWYGLPIKKESGVQLIQNVSFADKEFYLKKIRKSLFYNYKKAPYYEEVMEQISPLLDFESDSLSEYNINAITSISSYLGLKTKFFRQSDLIHQQHSTELLIELLKQVNAKAYLCGNGAGGYQEDHRFVEEGIELIYQNYKPLTDKWLQIRNENEAGLSVLHNLFYNGLQSKGL